MNVERLHALLAEVWADLQATNMKGRLEDLQNALQNAVNTPAEASYQATVAEAREAVRSGLTASAVNEMPPASLEVLEEIEILGGLGNNLLEEFDEIFQRNQVTQSVALDEVTGLVTRYQEITAHLENLLGALDYFKIGVDDLSPGESEITLVIPRPFVRDSLEPLGEEFKRLHKLIGPFQELATGSREEIPVRTISSSNFLLGLDVDPGTAAAFATAVAWVLTQYKNVLGIRKMAEELRQMKLGSEADALEESATNMVVNSIGEITDSLMAEHEHNLADPGRVNEVRTDLKMSIVETARRIDVGFQMQVRAIPPEATETVDDEGEPVEGDPVDMEPFDKIEALRPQIEFLKLEGSPILAIEPGDGFEDASAEPQEPSPGA